MIPASIVEEIKRLLAQGKWSSRKIARIMGVSRGSVAAIANGRRPDYEARRREREEESEPLGPLGRCSECRAMVHLPCRLCAVRKRMAQGKIRRLVLGAEESLQVGLQGDHRVRYEQVRRRRMARERREEREEGREDSAKDKDHGQHQSVENRALR